MTIVAMLKVGQAGPMRQIGIALFTMARQHIVEFDGQTGLGFSFGCCNAAVAVRHDAAALAGYRDTPEDVGIGAVNGLDFAVIYGSSRLYRGLDHVANQHIERGNSPFASSQHRQHAEQTAILVAEGLHIPFWVRGGCCHVYVDFTPCVRCHEWLSDIRDEDWIVHYNVNLQQKVEHTKLRKQHFQSLNRKRRLSELY